ncbi:MAG: HEPN domain-containing protein [Tannerella sp.]|jgi:HEPN domain-containing protein|nr:HEPN domain-containing protein [Tannerella sp.]
MLSKQQHIDYWADTADKDWVSVDLLFNGRQYLHCLFWAHLVLEKLAKAHWVKTHGDNIPPKVHNIVWLLEESGIDLGDTAMRFLEKYNQFQLSTRYPDYVNDIYKVCTEEYTILQLEKVKEIRQCLLKML